MILFTIESSFKGGNPRERFARSLIGFPLTPPFRYTLRATPLGGYCVCLRQTINIEVPSFKLAYFLTFLTFSRLKFDNSLSLKQSNF